MSGKIATALTELKTVLETELSDIAVTFFIGNPLSSMNEATVESAFCAIVARNYTVQRETMGGCLFAYLQGNLEFFWEMNYLTAETLELTAIDALETIFTTFRVNGDRLLPSNQAIFYLSQDTSNKDISDNGTIEKREIAGKIFKTLPIAFTIEVQI